MKWNFVDKQPCRNSINPSSFLRSNFSSLLWVLSHFHLQSSHHLSLSPSRNKKRQQKEVSQFKFIKKSNIHLPILFAIILSYLIFPSSNLLFYFFPLPSSHLSFSPYLLSHFSVRFFIIFHIHSTSSPSIVPSISSASLSNYSFWRKILFPHLHHPRCVPCLCCCLPQCVCFDYDIQIVCTGCFGKLSFYFFVELSLFNYDLDFERKTNCFLALWTLFIIFFG